MHRQYIESATPLILLSLGKRAAKVVGDGFPEKPDDLRNLVHNKIIDKPTLCKVADHHSIHVLCYHPGYVRRFPNETQGLIYSIIVRTMIIAWALMDHVLDDVLTEPSGSLSTKKLGEQATATISSQAEGDFNDNFARTIKSIVRETKTTKSKWRKVSSTEALYHKIWNPVLSGMTRAVPSLF